MIKLKTITITNTAHILQRFSPVIGATIFLYLHELMTFESSIWPIYFSVVFLNWVVYRNMETHRELQEQYLTLQANSVHKTQIQAYLKGQLNDITTK